jgi:hypothetical protein
MISDLGFWHRADLVLAHIALRSADIRRLPPCLLARERPDGTGRLKRTEQILPHLEAWGVE